MSVALDRTATTDSGVSQTTENKSRSSPLGSTIYKHGVNFSIFSRAATGMELLLFDHEDDARPERIIPIDPSTRTYHYWHIFVPGLQSGQIYGYRAYGPSERHALRFEQGSSRPVRQRRGRAQELQSRSCETGGRRCCDRHEEPCRGCKQIRLARRRAAAAAVFGDDYL